MSGTNQLVLDVVELDLGQGRDILTVYINGTIIV